MSEKSTENKQPLDSFLLSLLTKESYTDFLQLAFKEVNANTLLSFTFPIRGIDPLAGLELLDDGNSYQYFWEKPNDEFTIAAGNSLVKITAQGKRRFKDINDQLSAIKEQSLEYSTVSHSHCGLYFLGGFSFFDENNAQEWASFGAASFTIPEWQIIKEGRLTLLTLNFKASDYDSFSHLDKKIREKLSEISGILDFKSDQEPPLSRRPKSMTVRNVSSSGQTFKDWVDSVNRAKKLIRQNKFNKIVLARKACIAVDEKLTPTHFINALREQYPNCYAFLIRQEGSKTFLGCTPERLVSFRKNYVLTEALAGSIQRGSTATEDAFLEKELMQSTKDADEHDYVIKAIEQRLASLVRKIERGTKPIIKKLINVQHLFTPITAWLKDEIEPLTILEQLHPTPAVGGYPWEKAAPYVQELENFDRGWYAGPVGWLNNKGGGEFAVAIRSGLINENYAHFYAGCGIVADSDARAEWAETILKLTPMLSAFQYD